MRALGDGKLLQQGKQQLGKAANKRVASSELSDGGCESEQSHQRCSCVEEVVAGAGGRSTAFDLRHTWISMSRYLEARHVSGYAFVPHGPDGGDQSHKVPP